MQTPGAKETRRLKCLGAIRVAACLSSLLLLLYPSSLYIFRDDFRICCDDFCSFQFMHTDRAIAITYVRRAVKEALGSEAKVQIFGSQLTGTSDSATASTPVLCVFEFASTALPGFTMKKAAVCSDFFLFFLASVINMFCNKNDSPPVPCFSPLSWMQQNVFRVFPSILFCQTPFRERSQPPGYRVLPASDISSLVPSVVL